MNSIYIHIPFCLQKCAYCDFYSVTTRELIPAYIEALAKEMKIYSKYYKNSIINTIYMGGGTPSLLSPEQLSVIVNQLETNFNFSSDLEFTLEVNPETVTPAKFLEFKSLGVNRISVGIQSFLEKELRYLGRVHNAEKAEAALQIMGSIFENINVDLIYCLPEQREADLLYSLKKALSFSPQHISCYELTYESRTPLYEDVKRKNELDYEFYFLVKDTLAKAGYQQYEISNYAKPGLECRHNLAYWSDQSYLGLGAAAHSYDRAKNLRWANKSDLKSYLENDFLEFKEGGKLMEKIIMGLRKNSGMPEAIFLPQYRETLQRMITAGYLEQKADRICYTEEGRLLSNKVLMEFVD